MSLHVRLRPDWKGSFRRTIARDAKGKSIDVRVFAPGEVIEIPMAELPFLADDLGKALQPMEWSDEFRKFRPVDLTEIDLPAMVAAIKAGTLKEPEPEPPAISQEIPEAPQQLPVDLPPEPGPVETVPAPTELPVPSETAEEPPKSKKRN